MTSASMREVTHTMILKRGLLRSLDICWPDMIFQGHWINTASKTQWW
jgi:hypothetical protein